MSAMLPRDRGRPTSPAARLGGLLALGAIAGMVAVFVGLTDPPRTDGATPAGPVRDIAVDQGRTLFLQSCASCHGPTGAGTAQGPSLVGVGSASADFYLSTGRMPLSGPGQPAQRQPVVLDEASRDSLVAFVSSLGPGPGIPDVVTSSEDVPHGRELYSANCAACHSASGAGGAIGGGAQAPDLRHATALQIAEAMLIGPGQMPVFHLSQDDRDAITSYVLELRTQPSPGGFDVGGVVAEGFVAVVVGLALLILVVRRVEPGSD